MKSKANTSNNIVLFPGNNNILSFPPKKQPTVSKEEIDENLDATKQYHIQEAINLLIPHMFNHLNMAGFTPKDEDDEFAVREGAFIVESIRSHMYSYYGMKHPFQKIVEKIFIKDPEEEGALIIAKSLKVILKD